MNSEQIINLLKAVADGSLSLPEAYQKLNYLPYENLEYARVDLHRSIRQGFPEVIYCPGKTTEQIVAIAQALFKHHSVVLGTRVSTKVAAEIQSDSPNAQYFVEARLIVWGNLPDPAITTANNRCIAVVTAGTADLPVAEEAALTLMACGVAIKRFYDIGIAGIHRLFDVLPEIQECTACIAIAGMDGVLPGTLAGLTAKPVIGVPTSTGYGTNFSGVAPLLTMLNSCAAGLSVVNIDNGFGAATACLRILSSMKQSPLPTETASLVT